MSLFTGELAVALVDARGEGPMTAALSMGNGQVLDHRMMASSASLSAVPSAFTRVVAVNFCKAIDESDVSSGSWSCKNYTGHWGTAFGRAASRCVAVGDELAASYALMAASSVLLPMRFITRVRL